MEKIDKDYIHFYCQPMKKVEYFGGSRATRQRHLKTSSTGDENVSPPSRLVSEHERICEQMHYACITGFGGSVDENGLISQ